MTEEQKREYREHRRNWAVSRRITARDRKEGRERERIKEEEILLTLQKDNKYEKERSLNKRSDVNDYLTAFSFIPQTLYYRRDSIPLGWKPHSYNERRRYTEFFYGFIYQYRVPQVLIDISVQYKTILRTDNRTIRIAQKLLVDIISGGSFYKKNKDYFTRQESHFFLNPLMAEIADPGDIYTLFFYAKCKARNMNRKLSTLVQRVFTLRFTSFFNHPLVTGFLDLLSRYPDYPHSYDELIDICDFVLEKIAANKKTRRKYSAFSFSGRTLKSVAALSKEWHFVPEQYEKRTGAHHAAPKNRCWNGLAVRAFFYGNEGVYWRIVQLLTSNALIREGKNMHNCVGSYAGRCAAGQAYIFNVSRRINETEELESIATLEVSAEKRLVQAKGKCNTTIQKDAVKVIRLWANENMIGVQSI